MSHKDRFMFCFVITAITLPLMLFGWWLAGFTWKHMLGMFFIIWGFNIGLEISYLRRLRNDL